MSGGAAFGVGIRDEELIGSSEVTTGSGESGVMGLFMAASLLVLRWEG
jgi:hypothetical protein